MTTAPLFACAKSSFDAEAFRRDFPALEQEIRGKPLVYLDQGASSLKPRAVIEAMDRFMRVDYANVHRGVYELSARSTEAYEGARRRMARFLNAAEEEIIFTKGTTEAINLVAYSWGRKNIKAGDEILVSALEHHANIVPWQVLAEEMGATVVVVPFDADGAVTLEAVKAKLSPRTKLAAFAHVSNVFGTVLPIAEIARAVHAAGALLLVDGAQAVAHRPVDLKTLGADFYAFSGHKLYGPSGIGVLWGRGDLLASMPPYQTGGDMIQQVSFAGTTYKAPPYRFEAGTPPIVEAVGLAAAVDYVASIGLERIAAHENDILAYATAEMKKVPGLTIHGKAPGKEGIVAFTMDGIHPHDIATIADQEGIAIRAGHHCAEPLHDACGVAATARASFGVFTTRGDIDRLVTALRMAKEIFG